MCLVEVVSGFIMIGMIVSFVEVCMNEKVYERLGSMLDYLNESFFGWSPLVVHFEGRSCG